MILMLGVLAGACAEAGPVGGDEALRGEPAPDAPADESAIDPPERWGGPGRFGDSPGGWERPAPDLERVAGEAPRVTGEVPHDAMSMVLADASARTGVAAADIEVLRAEFVEWPDGSLGCPEPGVFYTQAIEPGYRVELRAGDRELDYRLTVGGAFKLCERSAGIPGKAPDSEPRTDDSDGDGTTGAPDG